MNYITLETYKKKWIFTHQSMPVAEDEKPLIKPMTEARAGQLWNEYISKLSPSVSHFSKTEWPMMLDTWKQDMDWQTAWDDDEDLPEIFLAHFNWDDNAVIYFCYDKKDVIETKWIVFKKYWKNFLFYDDNPLLICKKAKTVAQFQQNGHVKLGLRP